jgi:hypothetical protein
MAYGPIDPARLDGKELARWYTRSPLDLEKERSAAETQRYHAFAATPHEPALAGAGQHSRQALAGFRLPRMATASHEGAASPVSMGILRAAAVRPQQGSGLNPSTQRGGNGHVCAACHWGGTPPFPPRGQGILRDGISQPPSKPPERDRKQCEIQDARDREICGRQPNNAAKSVCHETASNRYAHCLRTGEVGEPNLFTIPRMPR